MGTYVDASGLMDCLNMCATDPTCVLYIYDGVDPSCSLYDTSDLLGSGPLLGSAFGVIENGKCKDGGGERGGGL